MTGDLILPHHNYPIPGNTNKVINYESQREIFLSTQESFPLQADINMNNNFIQNIATPTSSHQVTNKGYCDYNFLNRQKGGVLMGPLSMNRNDLTGIPDTPKFGYSAVNKNYVDGEITKIDTTQFVKKVCDTMIGVLNMNGNKIKNVGTPFTYENDAAVNVGFFNTELNASNSNVLTQITTNYEQYIDEKLLKSHLLSSEVKNAFTYLSDINEISTESNIIVHAFVDFNNSPHKNKKAYDIDMVYSPGAQTYNSKFGINLYPLDIGKYTVIMEYYYPEDLNIIIFVEVTKTTTIKKQVKFDESNYKKYLVQFDFPAKANPPHYLFFTIRGSGTTSTNPEGYIVLYGVKGWDDTVPSEIYDHALETGMFEYNDGNMKIYHDIDMNNHRIKNISQPTNPTDLLMKQSLDIYLISLHGMIRQDKYFAINNQKLFLFHINISFIIIFGKHVNINTQDKLIINYIDQSGQSSYNFPFSFHRSHPNVRIGINREIKGKLESINTLKTFNVPFILFYSPVTMKTT